MTTLGIPDLLRSNARSFPHRGCLLSDEVEYTFADVDARTDALAHGLAQAGARKGTRVALFATDSVEYVELIVACMKLGAVYVPLNYKLTQEELRALLESARAELLFISARYDEMVSAVEPALPQMREVFAIEPIAGRRSIQDLYLPGGGPVRVDMADSDLVGLCFTSGTTTRPKAVKHSLRFAKSLMYQTIVERRLPPDTLHFSAAPLFHVAGMFYPLAGIARGYGSLVLPSFDPRQVLSWLRSGRVDGCFLVPTMISTLLQQPDVGPGDLTSVRSIAYGGAPMSPGLLRRAMEVFNCDFINMFGAGTEAGFQTILSPEDHRRALDGRPHLLKSIGRPAMSVELRLCDDQLRDVPQGEVGEIVTRSDGLMDGYLDMPEETDRALVDGWFRGGDAAWMDEEGYLYLSGRKKDMIIRGGENIYPIEIETVLQACEGVREVAVVGVPDEHWGEIVRAYLVVDDPDSFDEAVLRRACRARLAAYKVPEQVMLLAELPRNASGKVLKRELRQLADVEAGATGGRGAVISGSAPAAS